ncbi:MAG: DapH/DapD/GlmU-related protein [Eubacteriales bacterium]|jgi:maltose O-acetyltransferase|nr:DapH/DapD/GlmU-related protein [Eubacteriales bacterium]
MLNGRKFIGIVLYKCLAKHLPASCSPIRVGQTRLRRLCGRLILARCGKNVNIERNAVFSHKVELGNNSGIGLNASVGGTCIIGDDVIMGPHCTIYTINHAFGDIARTIRSQGYQPERPVIIGDDVWIGGGVTILPGVRIGSHSVIGACSVVTKDVPDWAVAAGNPAAVKKYRIRQ